MQSCDSMSSKAINKVTKVQSPLPASVTILGVRVDCVNFRMMLAQLETWISDTTDRIDSDPFCRQICTVNPEFVIDANADPTFAAVLQQADLCVPDGIGILWAAQRKGVALTERVTGSDGIYRICEHAALRNWRVYFLGAAEGVAKQTARQLQSLYPALQVAGYHSGNPTDLEWTEIAALLHHARPDILFVAFGHPKQDLWIASHREELPVKVAIGVGGAFDFVVGIQQRAPKLWQQLGLEWLYRLVQEPKRWRRMLKLPLFALRIWWQGKID